MWRGGEQRVGGPQRPRNAEAYAGQTNPLIAARLQKRRVEGLPSVLKGVEEALTAASGVANIVPPQRRHQRQRRARLLKKCPQARALRLRH